MNITRQQFETAERGAPVEIVAENKKYILISRDVYEQLAHLQDQELDPEKTYGAVWKHGTPSAAPTTRTTTYDGPDSSRRCYGRRFRPDATPFRRSTGTRIKMTETTPE